MKWKAPIKFYIPEFPHNSDGLCDNEEVLEYIDINLSIAERAAELSLQCVREARMYIPEVIEDTQDGKSKPQAV